jgi:hypothetical protein
LSKYDELYKVLLLYNYILLFQKNIKLILKRQICCYEDDEKMKMKMTNMVKMIHELEQEMLQFDKSQNNNSFLDSWLKSI